MIDPDDFSLMMLADERRLDLVAAAVASTDPLFMGTETVVQLLDSMAPPDAASVDEVLGHVFGALGFRGNSEHYYSASNSLFDRVLIRRVGNPLSLAVVAAEIARRRGIALDVVGMPGHVVLGVPDQPMWFDPFAGARPMSLDDLRGLHGRLFPDVEFDQRVLTPMTPPAVAARMLQNLRVAAQRTGDRRRLVDVVRLRVRIPGAPVSDRLDLANLLMLTGRWEEAAVEHNRLAELRPNRAELHQRASARCRAHLN